MRLLVTLAMTALLSFAAAAKDVEPPLETIEALDLPKYLGTWYEIAKFPNWFQKNCAGSTRADYSLQPDGTVQVVNSCKLESGIIQQAVGTARQIGGATSPKLQVRFAPAWLSFLPMVWGDYWVIDIDPDYTLAAVSEPRRDYLWVLARTPQVDPRRYQDLLGRLARRGFDIGKLEVTRQ